MASGAYERHPCPGCGKKTMTPGTLCVTEFFHISAVHCRSCKCSFAEGLLVRGTDRFPTDEMRKNRATRLLAEADHIEKLAHDRIATAAMMREDAAGILKKVKTP